MEQFLFTNVVVLDCTGAEPFPGEVLIDGDRIKTVARAETPLPREGVAAIDGKAGFLMPGLVESHTHLSIDNTSSLTEIRGDASRRAGSPDVT